MIHHRLAMAMCASLLLASFAGCRDAPAPHRLVLVVPDGYRGIVRVITDPAGGDAPVVGDAFVVAVPRNGLARVKPLPSGATRGQDWHGVGCRYAGGANIPSGPALEAAGAIDPAAVASWVLGRLVVEAAAEGTYDLFIGTAADRDRARSAPGHFAPGDVATMKRYYALAGMGKAAYALGDLASAESSARELLALAGEFSGDWNHGNAIHDGNMLLGLVALRSGDVAAARERLAAAGATTGSPQLDSFGPNMTLAKAMIERGERAAVSAYLDACARFWKLGSERLAAWRQTLEAGGMPDFGANLQY